MRRGPAIFLALVGVVLLFMRPGVLAAQAVPAPAAEVPMPVKPPTDSLPPAKRDTIKPRFARESVIEGREVGADYRWTRAELYGSGALTLGDLLDRVPGLHTLRSGWLSSQQFGLLAGEQNRVRVFFDGVEIDNLDDRSGRSLDLSWIQLWMLDQVIIERSAGEIRVHARTWQPESTTPYTRTDVFTGDEDTNIYRGFYGKRFERGQVVQIGAQQFNTTTARSGGGGDGLSVLGRTGIARKNWSVDLVVNRARMTRLLQRSFLDQASVPELDATRTNAYLRGAVGNAGNGPWAQLIAASQRYRETSPFTDDARARLNRVPVDTVDSARSETQYVARVGYSLPGFSVEAGERMRLFSGKTYHDLSARADGNLGPVQAGLFAERGGFRASRIDVSARFQPTGLFAVAGGFSQRSANRSRGELLDSRSIRVDAGVRAFGAWLSFGLLSRDSAVTGPPSAFGLDFAPERRRRDEATYATLRGGRKDGISFDAMITRWTDSIPFQPRLQSRAEARFHSLFLKRFPAGNFELTASGIHEYRSRTSFVTSAGILAAPNRQTLSALVEVRIMRAVISYQLRNALGYIYEEVPGFIMPRGVNLYGVRWEFWN